MSRTGLDVMLAFFDAARRARGPVPSPFRATRTPRAPSSQRTMTARAPSSRPKRWVVDVPEDGERARVLIVRATGWATEKLPPTCLEYIERCEGDDEPPVDNLHDLEVLLRQLARDDTCLRVLRIEALR